MPENTINTLPLIVPAIGPNLIDKHNTDINKKTRLVEEKSWVKGNHPLGKPAEDCDFKLLGLIAGDDVLSKSGYEGGRAEVTTTYFAALLKQVIGKDFEFARPFKSVLANLQEHLAFCSKVSKRLAVTPVHHVEAYAQELYLENNNKEEIFLPLSYVNQTSGSHAMMIGINRSTKRVTIYNSGDGLENHQIVSDTAINPLTQKPVQSPRFQEFLVIKDCDPHRLNSPEFYAYILSLTAIASDNGQLELNADRVYTGMQNFLKGRIEKPLDIEKYSRLYRKTQRSGTCSVKCILAMIFYRLVLENKMTEEQAIDCYKKMKFLWQTQALVAVFQKPDVKFSDKDFPILNGIIENISRSVLKLDLRNLLTQEEIAGWEATCLDLQERIKQLAPKAVITAERPDIIVKALKEEEGYVNVPNAVKQTKKENDSKPQNAPKFVLDATHGKLDEGFFNAFKALNKPTDFKDLTAWSRYIQAVKDIPCKTGDSIYHFEYHKEKVLRGIWEEFLHVLPMPAKDSVWQSFTPEESLQKMEELFRLINLLEKTCVTQNFHNIHIVVNYCLFAVADALARNCPDARLNGYSFNSDFLLPDERDLKFFTISHPHVDIKFAQASRYFKNQNSIKLFPNGKLELKKESFKKCDTVKFFKQFLTKQARDSIGNHLTELDQVGELMTGKELPESFRLLYRAYCFSTNLKSNNKEPQLTVTQYQNPRILGLRVAKRCVNSSREFFERSMHSLMNPLPFEYILQTKDQNTEVISSQNYYSYLDLENGKKLRMLAIASLDRANRAIGFFKKNMQLFQEDGADNFFLTLFFSPGSLQSILQHEPEYIKVIESFLDSAIGHFRQQKDIPNTLKMIKMAQSIKTYLTKGGYAHTLPCYRTLILDEIIGKDIKGDIYDKSLSLSALWELYKDVPPYELCQSKEAVKDFVTCLLGSRVSGHIVGDIMLQQLETWFKDNAALREEFLTHWLKFFYPSAKPSTWTGEYPSFACEGYEINLETMRIEVQSKNASNEIPEEVKSHPVFALFKDKPVTAHVDEFGIYHLKGNNIELEVTHTPSEYVFQRIVENKKYQICSRSQKSLVLEYSKGLINPTALMWYELSNTPTILVEDNGFKYRIHLEKGLSGINRMIRLERLSDKAIWADASSLPPELSYLSKFDSNIRLFIDPQTKKVKEILLEEHQLQFIHREIQGKSYLYCKEHPGCFLTKNASFPLIDSTITTITLSNNKKEQIVLLPRNKLVKDAEDKSLFAFRVENEELVGDLIDAKLALVFFHIEKSQYENANKLLSQLFFVNRLADTDSTKEYLLLKKIHKILVGLDHPEGVSVALRLIRIELLNRQIHPLKENEVETDYCFNFEKYKPKIIGYSSYQSTACKLEDDEYDSLINLALAEADVQEAKETKRTQEYTRTSLPSEYILGRHKFVPVSQAYEKPQYQNLLDDLDFNQPQTHGFDITQHPLLLDRNFFQNNVVELYAIAVSGNVEQKKRLGIVLDLNDKLDSLYFNVIKFAFRCPALCPSRAFFEKLVRLNANAYRPNFIYKSTLRIALFPLNYYLLATAVGNFVRPFFSRVSAFVYNTFHQKKLSFFAKKWTANTSTHTTPLKIDGKTLQDIDSAFDNYFDALIEKHLKFVVQPTPETLPTLPETHDDPQVKAELINENKKLAKYRKHRLRDRRDVSVTGDLKELHYDLTEKSAQLTAKIKMQQQALVWQINHVPSGSPLEEIKKVGQHQQLTWVDLQRLTIEGDFEKFKAVTALDEEQANILFNKTAQLLAEGSRLHQLNDALVQVSKAINETNPAKQNLYLELLLEKLEIRVSQVPERKQIERLWFEFANGFLYRKEQLEKINKIISHEAPELQAEMPTGFGKSKCLVTTLNQFFSKLGKLVFNCCPASLEMTNLRDWFSQMWKSFGLRADYISFDRSSNFTSTNLEFLYLNLLSHKKNKTSVTVRPESIRALELHFTTILDESNNQPWNKETDRKIEFFTLILQLLYTESWIVIDEEHVNLSPIDRLIYTLGMGTRLPDRDIGLLEKMFEFMIQEPLASVFNIGTNNQCYVTKENYAHASNLLADKFADYFEISQDNKQTFKNFVLGIEKNPPEGVLTHKSFKEICLLKGELCYILSSSLSGKVNTDFGLSHEHADTKEYAISYSGANTPKETKNSPSQFKNPHETMTKTYITYLFEGLTSEKIKKLLRTLQQESKDQAGDGGSLDKTPANDFYKSIAPKDAPHLQQLNDYEIELLVPALQKNPKVIFYYIRNIIVQQLILYPETVVSTAQDARGEFTNSFSMSATPQETAAHGPETQFIPMKHGSSARPTHLFLTKCNDPETIKILKGNTSEECLNEALDQMEENSKMGTVIDVGAQFAGLSNLQIAQKMRERFKDNVNIEGIMFFDEEKLVFKILEMSTGTIVDPGEVDIKPEERKTIYDQNRCVGSDNLHDIVEVALMMTGIDDKDAIGQAAGRMRQWERDQSVHVATHEKIADEIFKGKEKNIVDLLVYWTVNKIRKRENLNFQSQIQQIDHILRRGVLNSILGITYDEEKKTFHCKKPDPKKAKSLHAKNRDIFITTESFDPEDLYAKWDNSTKPLDYLKKKYDSAVARVKLLAEVAKSEKERMLKRLALLPPRWLTMAFPFTVPSSMDMNMECEVQQHIDLKCELQTQTQEQERFNRRTSLPWRDSVDMYINKWDKPRELYPLLKRAVSKIIGRIPGTISEELFLLSQRVRTEVEAALPEMAKLSGIALAATAVCAGLGYACTLITAAGWLSYLAIAVNGLGVAVLSVGLGLGLSAGYLIFCTALAGTAYGSARVFMWVSDKLTGFFHTDTYIASVRDIMRTHLPTKHYDFHRIIDKDLFATHNFFRESLLQENLELQKPFNTEQKPIYQALLIQDTDRRGRKHLKMVVFDQNESDFFHEKVIAEYEKQVDETRGYTRKVAIYDMEQEAVVMQGQNRYESNELQNNPKFHSLIASAKVINGEVKYTEKEEEYLLSQLTPGLDWTFYEYFKTVVLGLHERRAKLFDQTSLATKLSDRIVARRMQKNVAKR